MYSECIDLPQIRSIKMKSSSFENCSSMMLLSLSSLQIVDIGRQCMNEASEISLIGITIDLLELADLPQLQSLTLGEDVIHHCYIAEFKSDGID